jgi:TPR repeat protein
MKSFIAIAVVLLAVVPAAPAFAQMGSNGGNYDDYTGGIRNEGLKDPRRDKTKIQNGPEGVAEDLRLKGKCDQAVPMFRELATQEGGGYEISQFNLGLCLFDLAKAEKDPAQAQALNKEGTSWILRAANAGFGKAQAMAVLVYLDGLGVAPDPVEAGKWAYIFHDNGMRLVLGLPDIDPSVRGRLDAVLTGDRKREARARADSWTQTGERIDQ